MGRSRLLTDENVYHDIVEALRRAGYDLRTVAEEGLAGASDSRVITRARREGRILVTFDRDFSDIRHVPHDIPGIILLRFRAVPIEVIIKRLLGTLQELTAKELAHRLIVITPSSTRRRRLGSKSTLEKRHPL